MAAIGRGPEDASLSKKLGASEYIDSKSTDAVQALQKMGGARVILATARSSKAMSQLIDGLGPNGKLIVVGVELAPIEVPPVQLISGNRSIQGWMNRANSSPSGVRARPCHPTDASDDNCHFETGVRQIENDIACRAPH